MRYRQTYVSLTVCFPKKPTDQIKSVKYYQNTYRLKMKLDTVTEIVAYNI